jgi:hypothetical protein
MARKDRDGGGSTVNTAPAAGVLPRVTVGDMSRVALLAACLLALGCPSEDVPVDDTPGFADPRDLPLPRPGALGPLPDQEVGSGGGGPCGIAAGDLDGDGDLDLAVSHILTSDIGILLNQGDDGFVGVWHWWSHHSPVVLGEELGVVTIADLNGDGANDIAVSSGVTNEVIVLTNPGKDFAQQGFAAEPWPVGEFPYGVAAAPLNDDEHLDLVVSNGTGGSISVLLNTGGGFEAGVEHSVGGDEPGFVSLKDVTGDGILDAVTSNHFTSEAAVLPGLGGGDFDTAQTFPTGEGPSSPSLADADGDGDLDLFTSNEFSSDVSYLANDGAGQFEELARFDMGEEPYFVAPMDYDGDGDIDLAVPLYAEDRLVVWFNDGDGNFGPILGTATGDEPTSIATGDFDGDGDPDLAVTNFRSDTVSIFLNRWNETEPE